MSDIVERLNHRALLKGFGVEAEAAAEIERLRSLVTWRPIETAPLETDVLVFSPTDHPQVLAARQVNTEHGTWWEFCDEALCDMAPEGPQPTHWLPLPPPPTKGE